MFIRAILFFFAILTLSPVQAWAHPHVFVTAKTSVVFSKNGEVEGLRHAWTFDKMFSAYAIQGLGGGGAPTRADLQGLAKENAEGLVDFKYFTTLKTNGVAQVFQPPRDYYMEFADGELTLHFFLPLAKPVHGAKSTVWLEIYDPTYFIAFMLAPGNDAVALAEAPQGCAVSVTRPKQLDTTQQAKYSEDFFNNLPEGSSFTLQFANRALIACP